MAKNARKILLFSLLILLSACAIPPTYSRKDISATIKRICKDEFNLQVTVWDYGDTVWVYAPMKLVDDEGKLNITKDNRWKEEVSEDMRKISVSLNRVFLSIDKPPKFYCFIRSNILIVK